jgi:hypothetical protein
LIDVVTVVERVTTLFLHRMFIEELCLYKFVIIFNFFRR